MFDCVYRDEVKQKIKERMKYLDDARIMNKGDTETLNQIKGFEKALNQIYCDIDDIRTAVLPVKHGRWIIKDDVEHFIAVCSECGRTEDSRDIKNMPYCHCGARLDGDAE